MRGQRKHHITTELRTNNFSLYGQKTNHGDTETQSF